MSASTLSLTPARSSVIAVAPLAVGGALLLLRFALLNVGLRSLAALACIYAALAATSLSAPIRARAGAALPASLVTVMGVAAFTLVALAPWQTVVPTTGRVVAIVFGVAAAVAEEAFFRRLLFDRLLPAGAAVAVAGSAVAFALVHVPLYGTSVLWVDLGAGLLLAWQRWASGAWGAAAVTHSFANVLAVIR